MSDDSISKKVLQGLGELGVETLKEGTKQTLNMVSTVITGQELVGDAKAMSEEEMAQAQREDERKKQEGLDRLREVSVSQGRNVESEIKDVVEEKKNDEEEKEKEFLDKIRLQREAEERERQEMLEIPENQKKETAKRQNAPGKHKKQEPNMTQMSQTSEFKGGKID